MIIDAHCDALMKLWQDKLGFHSSKELQVNYSKWVSSSVRVQCFAIFVPDKAPEEVQFQIALKMIGIFHKQIIEPYENVKFISTKKDLMHLKDDEMGAILTLEGCHPIGRDLTKLRTLIRLGVRAVGLTWNQANAVCDGIKEERGAGLSSFGREVVNLLNQEKIWTDVSHISYKGFFDVMELAAYPMASHSNAYDLTPHKRNLDDAQIEALINRSGWIGVTYVPSFLTYIGEAAISDVIKHIHYLLGKGAEDCLGFGSDFDGTERFVEGLYDLTDYDVFINRLHKSMPSSILRKICYQNFIKKFPHETNS